MGTTAVALRRLRHWHDVTPMTTQLATYVVFLPFDGTTCDLRLNLVVSQ